MGDENKTEPRRFMGMPMRWEPKGIFKTLWNPNDDALFPPKSFGIGWTINFHAVLRSVGVIKNRPKDANPREKNKN